MVWVTFLRYGKKAPRRLLPLLLINYGPVAVDVTFRLIKRLSFTLSSSISVTLWFCYSVNMSVVVATRPLVMNDFYQVTNPNSQSPFEGQAEVSRDHLCTMLWDVVTAIVLCLWFFCMEAIKVSNWALTDEVWVLRSNVSSRPLSVGFTIDLLFPELAMMEILEGLTRLHL